ncbi:MAG: MobP3 family relaxase, partial [Candidatus Absconditabacteria bacterium]|nr:MobP3 family relaxase [Candidatus Absconditabacteria bacterium]
MPRLILKCPYLKGGSERASAHLENLVNYIATRDGVEKIRVEDKNLSSTIKQEELIAQIIKEFPNTKNLFEYEDYIQNSTIENASEFISVALEQNFDKIGKRKNYVDYIANRPNVEKMGKHGLFTGGNDDLVLNRIVNEVANYDGNIWTPIISLKREDATRLGYDNAESWHNMLSYYAIDIAECLKIKPENFQWYAAFHNEGHHPHVHMICYSTDPKEGYLTKKGIEKMKSGFVKNIFGQELEGIYIGQSKRRDELKEESREVLVQIISEMKNSMVQNSNIEEKLLELAERLKFTRGKRQYGYLQPQLKAMVDEIVDELAKDERVEKAYRLWYEMRNEVLHSYMDNLPEPLP